MNSKPDPQQIETVRSFNRFYTRQIGVLEEAMLDTRFTLTQARVLFELGTHSQITASAICDALGLDVGYLSRILQDFVSQGLVSRKQSPHDGRHILLSLTAKGRNAFHKLDTRSHSATSTMLAGLTQTRRHRLLAALRDAQAILSNKPGETAGEIVIRTHRLGDIGWAIERHAQLYAEEYQWNEELEAFIAKLFAQFAAGHDPAAEKFWIAEYAGERVGCVFVVRNAEEPKVAQLRCLLVDPRARGLGIGKRLVDECIGFSRAAGYDKMILWTNDVLVSARRLYEKAGFKLIKENRHHSFGHDLTGQIWEMEL